MNMVTAVHDKTCNAGCTLTSIIGRVLFLLSGCQILVWAALLAHIGHTVALENFTTEKVHEYVFSTIVDSLHELNIHDWVV